MISACDIDGLEMKSMLNSSHFIGKVNVMICMLFIWSGYECLIVLCAVAYVFCGGSLTEPVKFVFR